MRGWIRLPSIRSNSRAPNPSSGTRGDIRSLCRRNCPKHGAPVQLIRFLPCLVGALAATGALADQSNAPSEYPPGLFENSPVIGSQPDASAPGAEPAPDDCAGIESRVFRSLAEVKAAHARCDLRADPGKPE